MTNTIGTPLRPIDYGPHMRKNPRAERAIRFLEDPQNENKEIPPDLLLESETIFLRRHNREECAQFIREGLLGGTIG